MGRSRNLWFLNKGGVVVEGRVGEESYLGPQTPKNRKKQGTGEGLGFTQKSPIPEPTPMSRTGVTQLGKTRVPND